MMEQKKVDRAGAGAAETSHIAADPAPARRRRQTAARRQEAVLRVLRGEDIELVARGIDATAADVSGWRDAFLAGGASNQKHRVHAARIVICQDGEIVGAHERCFGRGQTIYNPWHHVPVLKRKPGALRNGAPFRDWTLPSAMSQFWTHLSDVSDGDRQMVDILFAAHEHSIDVVEAACAQALEAGLRRADAILNIVSRRTSPPPPKAIEPPAHLRLRVEPTADCARHDRSGGPNATA